MAGLSHLRDVYDKKGKDFLENLLNKTVIINENAKGSYFGSKKDSKHGRFDFFKKDNRISHVDRVLSRYYEPAIQYFERLTPDCYDSIPENYVFGMDYQQSSKFEPAKHLTLSHIKVLDEDLQIRDVIQEKRELDKWAGLLGINKPGILFQGKLNDDQKMKIQEFIFTPASELSAKFKTVSFTKYIISMLNPQLDEAAKEKMDSRNISEVVFRFYDYGVEADESAVLAKLVDPVVYEQQARVVPEKKVQNKSDDYIWIIVIDLMTFIEKYRISELRSFEIEGDGKDERYVSLINKLFREFINQYGEKYNDLDIHVPEILQRAEFDVNDELIDDPAVLELINKNKNYKEIYRVFINIFRKKKVKVNSKIFTDSMKANLDNQIQKLEQVAMGHQVFENYFPTFNEFVGEESNPGYFETYERENTEDSKVKRVNLMISEFQPVANNHVKNAKVLNEKNGLQTLLVGVHPNKSGKRFPFSKEIIGSCLNKLAASDPITFAGQVMVGDGSIESVLRAIKPMYEPVMIAAEPTRLRDLALQLELAKKRSRNLNIKRDTVLVELPIADLSERIVTAIKNKDISKFKELVPQAVQSEFYNLNKEVTNDSDNPVNESKVAEVSIKPKVEAIIELDEN